MKGKKGRNSLYTQATLDIIQKELIEHGCNQRAFKAAGISKEVFYLWMRKHPEFATLVEEAKQERLFRRQETLKLQADKIVEDLLQNGAVTKITIIEEGTSDKFGSYVKKTVREVRSPTPVKILDRVLGKPSDELEAFTAFVNAGWLPRSLLNLAENEINNIKLVIRQAFAGIFPDSTEAAITGLTPETAAALKQHLLGIQPADAFEISADVEPGQQPDQDLREIKKDRD
jgi:hypothetical protein